MINDILAVMPQDRECTLDDVCTRYKAKNGITPDPDVVKSVLRDAQKAGRLQIDWIAVDYGSVPVWCK